MKISKRLFGLMVFAILTLAVCFSGMVIVSTFQQGTIREYDLLTSEQQAEYEALAERYMDLSSADWQLQMDYDLLVEHYKTAATLSIYTYTPEEVTLLAKVAQCEAGVPSRSPTAFKWVVQVVLNRVNSPRFPNTISEVVYQTTNGKTPQFSVTLNGVLDNCEPTPESVLAVYEVLLFGSDLPSYVEFFYDERVTGNWINTLPMYETHDGTTFAYSHLTD